MDAFVEDCLANKKKIMGIGHRVYKVLDPRAPHLRKMAIKLTEELGEAKWINMSNRIAEIMKERKGLNANVDFYSATVYYSLGIPTDLYRRRGISRYLFRLAVRDLLPKAIWTENVKQEPIRVGRLVTACREALKRWREEQGDNMSSHPYIDRSRLYTLIDDIGLQEPNGEVAYIMSLQTAIKSVLVLNMGLPVSRPAV